MHHSPCEQASACWNCKTRRPAKLKRASEDKKGGSDCTYVTNTEARAQGHHRGMTIHEAPHPGQWHINEARGDPQSRAGQLLLFCCLLDFMLCPGRLCYVAPPGLGGCTSSEWSAEASTPLDGRCTRTPLVGAVRLRGEQPVEAPGGEPPTTAPPPWAAHPR